MDQKQITEKQLKTGFAFVSYGDRFAICGQPGAEDLREFKGEAWTDILNLRSQKELEDLDFEMSETCQTLGLNYNNTPIIVDGNIDKTALEKVHALLSGLDEDKKCVIHCASGTRAIMALIAHFVFSKSYEISELPALAGELGLSKPQMLSRLFQALNLSNA